MSHHTDFFRIRDFNARLAWLNMLLLFFIVMLPATTAILSDYAGNSSPWPSVLYAGTISGVYLSLAGIWTYAWRKGLTDDSVDAHEHRRILRGRIIAPAVFLLSIPAAFILGSNTPFLGFLIVPVALISRRLSRGPSRGTAGGTAGLD